MSDRENFLFEIKEKEKEIKKADCLLLKKDIRVTFRVNSKEKELLDLYGKWFVKPTSDYIRAAVFGYQIPDPEELELRKSLLNLNANQARLGNLLNQWLGSQYHSDITNELRAAEHIMKVLQLIENNQQNIKDQLNLLRLGKHSIQER